MATKDRLDVEFLMVAYTVGHVIYSFKLLKGGLYRGVQRGPLLGLLRGILGVQTMGHVMVSQGSCLPFRMPTTAYIWEVQVGSGFVRVSGVWGA